VRDRGLAALGSLAAGGDVRQGLLFFALQSYLYGVANLVPFLKLDGYIALAGGLDLPHLRRKAMADFHSWLAHVLLGARDTRQLPDVSWAAVVRRGMQPHAILVIGFAIANLGRRCCPWASLAHGCAAGRRRGARPPGSRRRPLHPARAGRRGGLLRTLLAGGLLAVAVASALMFVQVPAHRARRIRHRRRCPERRRRRRHRHRRPRERRPS
jgi:putative peptide zinc metalloprotease protein